MLQTLSHKQLGLNSMRHECSSECRKEGCPRCEHGMGDYEFCDICDLQKQKDTEDNNKLLII